MSLDFWLAAVSGHKGENDAAGEVGKTQRSARRIRLHRSIVPAPNEKGRRETWKEKKWRLL